MIGSFLLFLALLYYFAPWFSHNRISRHSPHAADASAAALCLAERISRYRAAIENFDAVVHAGANDASSPPPVVAGAAGAASFYPYVGNGLLGIAPDAAKEKEIYLKAPGSSVIALKVRGVV